MPHIRTVYVPRFNSQQGSSQRNELEPDQNQAESSSPKRGKKRGNGGRGKKTGSILKVKLPKLSSHTLLRKDEAVPVPWMLEPGENQTTVNPEEETQCADTNSAPADGGVYNFSQGSDIKATNMKEKAKLSVLRTISKMREENQLIRQRLAALRPAS